MRKAFLLAIYTGIVLEVGFVLGRTNGDFSRITGASANGALDPVSQSSDVPYTLPPEADPFLAENPRPYTLLFAGDIMLGRGVRQSIVKNGGRDYHFPFANIKQTIHDADFAFANLEGPISSRGENRGSIYSFRFDPKAAVALADTGFDAVSIANNHIWDWGPLAITDTVNLLKENGIAAVGAGANERDANGAHYFELGNPSASLGASTRVAVLAYTNLYPQNLKAKGNIPGISNFELNHILDAIRFYRSRADILIVSFHWGDEYQTHSNPLQESIAHALIDAGADLVIGHHPHVAEEIEQYKGKYIFYSLGNFVFDQGFSRATMNGIMAEILVKDKTIVAARSIPITQNAAFQPALSAP